MEEFLIKAEKYIICAFVFLLPVFMVPVFANPYILPKSILLVVTVALLVFVNLLKVLTGKSIKVSFGVFDIAVVLLALAYIGSTLARTPDKMEAILFPGTTTIIVASSILYFLINQIRDEDKSAIKYFLVTGAVVSSVVSIIATSGALAGIASLSGDIKSTSFSTLGGSLSAFIYFAMLLPISLNMFIKNKNATKKAMLGISLVMIVFGASVSAFDAFTSKNPSQKLPDFRTSWYVTIDSLKENPLWGMGAGNYATAFNRFRPISYNGTDLWATRFATSRSFYLSMVTENGIIGLGALFVLFLKVYKVYKRDIKEKRLVGWSVIESADFASLVLLLAIFLIFPIFVATAVVLFVLLGTSGKTKTKNIGFLSSPDNQTVKVAVSTPIIVIVLICLYYTARLTIAEIKYQQALGFAAQKQAKNSYDIMREAININPYVDRYRLTYSQLNLALALGTANKKDITAQDKDIISRLVQQSIREGRVTAAINPERASIWQNLGSIYKAIISLAKDADQFAIAAYTQAVSLDPIDVDNRINLGSVYFIQKNYEAAIDSFRLAVVAKPDHANAHYNLGLAYREKGNRDRAIAELDAVLTLVPQDSTDYKNVKKEIDDLKAQKTAEAPTKPNDNSPSALTQPQPSTSPINPKLDLGKEASPASSPAPAIESSPIPINP